MKQDAKIHPWFYELLRATLGNAIARRYKLKTENLKELENLPGPWFILPNHVMFWDPVLVAVPVRQRIHFIASDANFRNPVLSFLFRSAGVIPISKKAADITTVRQIVDTIRRGNNVALFPEGERTWDGVSMPIIPSTAKLVKLAKAPVIVPVLKGAYLSLPRWAFKSRPGPVTIDYKIVLMPDEINALSIKEIQDKIEKAVYHDEHQFQYGQMGFYKSKAPAEPLQLSLFICPECKTMNNMEGAGNKFTCKSCNWVNSFTNYGQFEPLDANKKYFSNIKEWSDWQNKELEERISRSHINEEMAGSIIFSDQFVQYSTGFKVKKTNKKGEGTLSLGTKGISFRMQGEEYLFKWQNVSALNVVYQNQLEFYHGKVLHIFNFPHRHTSGYKYMIAGRLCQKKIPAVHDG